MVDTIQKEIFEGVICRGDFTLVRLVIMAQNLNAKASKHRQVFRHRLKIVTHSRLAVKMYVMSVECPCEVLLDAEMFKMQ